jgi:hypothetical protein
MMCEFQWEICPSSQDMGTPNRVCRTVHPETKWMSNHVKSLGFGSKFSRVLLRYFGSFLLFRPHGFGAIKKVNTSHHWIRVVLGT